MDYAGMSPDSLSILEQYKGWYSLYAIFSSQVVRLVNVYPVSYTHLDVYKRQLLL